MNPALAALAVLVAAGAVVAASARDARFSTGALTIALVAATFVAQPLPDAPQAAVRVVAALLAGYVLWIATRTYPVADEVTPAWTTTAVFAIAAGVVGLSSSILETPSGTGTGVTGLPQAQAAAFALATVAAVPVVSGRSAVRLAGGLLLAVASAALLAQGLGPILSGANQLAIAALTVAVAGSGAALEVLANARGSVDRPSRVAAHPLPEPPGAAAWRGRPTNVGERLGVALARGRAGGSLARSAVRSGLASARGRVRAADVGGKAAGAVGTASGGIRAASAAIKAAGSSGVRGASTARDRLRARVGGPGDAIMRVREARARDEEGVPDLERIAPPSTGPTVEVPAGLDEAPKPGVTLGEPAAHAPTIAPRSAGAGRTPRDR
jgi:hypothetical protein